METLPIREVAARTGIAAGTIRMWEQRYGFPEPRRLSSGYRAYSIEDVEVLRRVATYRRRGYSVPVALERARAAAGATDRPSIFGALAMGDQPAPARVMRKRTLIAISRGIEEETLARGAGPVVIGAFQTRRNYRAVEHRYRRLAEVADATIVFADFPEVREPAGAPAEVPIEPEDALGNEWAVIVDAPGYAACLLAWEHPLRDRVPDMERPFECFWTMDPASVRRAALASTAIARRSAPDLAERMETLLSDRPLAIDTPAPALTALANRIVGYLDEAA